MDREAFVRLVDVGYDELEKLFGFPPGHGEFVSNILGDDSDDDPEDREEEAGH